MPTLPPRSVDLVFGSPPYEDCRTYGIGFAKQGQEWVDWMVQVVRESLRACKGLVAFVVEGKTRHFRWSATPVLLLADLHRAGVCLRKPPAFYRVGIAGSGGPDWLRNDYEFIVCATNGGKLAWSDNTAMGHPPKWAPGGEMSHRVTDGSRVNQWGHPIDSGVTVVLDGGVVRSSGTRPSHRLARRDKWGRDCPTGNRDKNGNRKPQTSTGKVSSRGHDKDGNPINGIYEPPVLANPGNVIHCRVGGGLMGSKLAHDNEAPFPESLAEFFIRSFCPPGGIVCDPFSGSGTTAATAEKNGRRWIACDVRESQAELTRRRIEEVRSGQLRPNNVPASYPYSRRPMEYMEAGKDEQFPRKSRCAAGRVGCGYVSGHHRENTPCFRCSPA
ncbi:MAG: site-specific DNA-methyltransferase [Planctomycetaceae bacterium]|nr:site-specific DNA-methyltransferase [Planctomycetaceae bacterium]